ncbi:hypothetical protein, partial [Pseudomonas carnis]|uniref:hypothetical protein n=1 Tax=Pseudomonas carnis TaxID=2487355 RepID=UPI002449818F
SQASQLPPFGLAPGKRADTRRQLRQLSIIGPHQVEIPDKNRIILHPTRTIKGETSDISYLHSFVCLWRINQDANVHG